MNKKCSYHCLCNKCVGIAPNKNTCKQCGGAGERLYRTVPGLHTADQPWVICATCRGTGIINFKKKYE